MAFLMSSCQKQKFVQSMLMLQETSQEIFVGIVQSSLDDSKFAKTRYQHNIFNRIISEFDE